MRKGLFIHELPRTPPHPHCVQSHTFTHLRTPISPRPLLTAGRDLVHLEDLVHVSLGAVRTVVVAQPEPFRAHVELLLEDSAILHGDGVAPTCFVIRRSRCVIGVVVAIDLQALVHLDIMVVQDAIDKVR